MPIPRTSLRVADLIRARFPELYVSCSSEISREFREYERASTTALSAYVQPIIDSYLGRFEERLAREGFTGRFSIMQSNGGRLPASVDPPQRDQRALLRTGRGRHGRHTPDRRVRLSQSRDVRHGRHQHRRVPGAPTASRSSRQRPPSTVCRSAPRCVDIASVGAGGGSIVWRDSGGMLRVGPRSSGADPGPACYGRGGTAPTITDAHVIRGTHPAAIVPRRPHAARRRRRARGLRAARRRRSP